MALRLLTIPFSHYCEKARWALDLSTLKYIEDAHLPMIHYAYNKKYGADSTVPALVTEDGVLTDSADILDFVHRHGVNLYPKAHETDIRSWEKRFNQVLGPQTRVWAYSQILPYPDILRKMIHASPALEKQLASPFLSMVGKLIAQKYRIRPGSDKKSLAEVLAIWAQSDYLLKDGRRYLVGDCFSAADLTLSALGGIMVLPPEYGYPYPTVSELPLPMQTQIYQMRQTPTGQHILRMYQKHRALHQSKQKQLVV